VRIGWTGAGFPCCRLQRAHAPDSAVHDRIATSPRFKENAARALADAPLQSALGKPPSAVAEHYPPCGISRW